MKLLVYFPLFFNSLDTQFMAVLELSSALEEVLCLYFDQFSS